MIATPQFIFDFHKLYTSLQTLIDTGLYRDSNYTCSMSSYMIFPHTSISFCCSKFGSFGHTYTIFTHIFNQFYGSQSVNFNSKLLSYLYWLINMIKTNCILSLPCPREHLDSKISRYWLTDESFLTFGYDLISRKKEILSNTDTFDIFCGVCNSSLCDNCSDPICGYTSGINLKNARLITNTNTKLSMIMLDSGASLACTPFKEDFEKLTLIKGDEKVIKGIAKGLAIKGLGLAPYALKANDGSDIVLLTKAYYVPEMPQRLVSPQSCSIIQGNPVKFSTFSSYQKKP